MIILHTLDVLLLIQGQMKAKEKLIDRGKLKANKNVFGVQVNYLKGTNIR